MTRREKRERGVLPMQLMRRTRHLCKNGDITRDMSRREAAVVVMLDTAGSEEFHDEWEKLEVGSVDWDALLNFIERLLAILLPLFLPTT